MFAEEEVAENSYASSLLACPEASQSGDRFYFSFLRLQVADELLAVVPFAFNQRLQSLFVLLHKDYYGFSQVSCDVFGLIRFFCHYSCSMFP
jgi:hypothetical protein